MAKMIKRRPARTAKKADSGRTDRQRVEAERYFTDEVLLAMGKANTNPAFAYAFKKNRPGAIFEGNEEELAGGLTLGVESGDSRVRSHEGRSRGADAPPPDQWSSNIPTLALSGFTMQDLERVHALVRAIAPIEKQGPMTLRARWEFAAAVLATALSSAYDAGMDAPLPDQASTAAKMLFDMTIAPVVESAQEIYAQGSA